MGLGPAKRPRAQEFYGAVPGQGEKVRATVADRPGRCRLEQLRQAWELPSRQLCPQGQAQHSSRLPAEALAEPACSWHCRVAKQWPPGVASARAVVGEGENGATQTVSLDTASLPHSLPEATDLG